MAEKFDLTFICEDCGHKFEQEVDDHENTDHVRCPECESEFVNHDMDRSLFLKLGIPELDKCNPEACTNCSGECPQYEIMIEEQSKKKG